MMTPAPRGGDSGLRRQCHKAKNRRAVELLSRPAGATWRCWGKRGMAAPFGARVSAGVVRKRRSCLVSAIEGDQRVYRIGVLRRQQKPERIQKSP